MKKTAFVLCLILILVLVGCGEVAKPQTEPTNINYEIVSKDDLSMANTVRYSWEIVVNDKIGAKDLEALSKEIIGIAEDGDAFNALVINFYDYREYIGRGYTLGKTTYAPDGDWSKAGDINAGDYSVMDYTFELREKDWDKQLTADEVKIYKAWNDLFDEKDDSEDWPDEDEISEDIAEQFNITADEVNGIMGKSVEWMFSDTSQ